MMEARELRIGNIIKKRSNDTALTVDLKLLEKVQRSPVFYKGIPLTPEWLERAGFVLLDDGGELKGNDRFWVHGKLPGSLSTKFIYQFGGTKIEYVNQLQNLFFALTGEELTIKQ